MSKLIIKKQNINQLRNIIREESYHGSLQAALRLQGCDKELIRDNQVCELLADQNMTTPLLESNYKKSQKNAALLKGLIITIIMVLMFFEVLNFETIKILLEILI